jgi:hypothetical protein
MHTGMSRLSKDRAHVYNVHADSWQFHAWNLTSVNALLVSHEYDVVCMSSVKPENTRWQARQCALRYVKTACMCSVDGRVN